MSTSARAPWFKAIIRFWIRVESLKRPPTLLTISSSFSSSIMVSPRSTAVSQQDRRELVDRAIELVVDHMDIITHCHRLLATSLSQPAPYGFLVVGSSHAESGLQSRQAWG